MMQKKKFVNRQPKKAAVAVIVCMTVVSIFISGCGLGNASGQYQNTGFAMGTVIAQNMYGGNEKTAEEILHVISELEQTISWRLEGTEVDRINDGAGSGQPVEVSEKLAGWIRDCLEVYEVSGGKLDVTVGPVARLWDIGGENPRIPEEEELADALKKVDAGKLLAGAGNLPGTTQNTGTSSETETTDKNSIWFHTEGGQLDLGAVGKGIGCDEIFDYIVTNYPKINGTFSVGGSVLIYGEKPDGQPWKIGIRDPRGEEAE